MVLTSCISAAKPRRKNKQTNKQTKLTETLIKLARACSNKRDNFQTFNFFWGGGGGVGGGDISSFKLKTRKEEAVLFAA